MRGVKVVLSKAAQRALVRSAKRKLLQQKIRVLATDPGSLASNVKRLVNRSQSRLRAQDWRVIFRVEMDTLFIDEIGARGSVYGE